MRALLVMLLVSACAPKADILWHATSTYRPEPTLAPVDVFVDRAPAQDYRIVGLLLVSPKYDVHEAARLAASTGQSLGCDLITTKRDAHEVAGAPRRILVASIGSFGLGEALGSKEGSGGSANINKYEPRDAPIDPRMRKFWCGVYVTDVRLPRSAG